jgi:hypothetical protein
MVDQSSEIKVDRFFGDANVQRLLVSSATWQPLQICYPREVNVSRLLAWLMDPTQGHGLGDLGIQSLLTRAWWNSGDATLPLATRRFLTPSNIHTEGFSSFLVATEVELNERFLDVLLIDATRRRYIAIENKFGAKQSDKQLIHYRKSLEEMFAGFLGIHILLDSNEAIPDDNAWIPVGYDWLADFLREAEQRESTAAHVQQTLAQFRNVIEDVAEDAMSSSPYGDLVAEVSSGHSQLMLELMKPWSTTAKGSQAQLMANLMANSGSLEGKAMLRLFQVYWRRKPVWDQCIKQAQFASFVLALKRKYNDIQVDPKRIRTSFTLQKWSSLIKIDEDEGYYFPAGINVRQTGETFQILSFVQFNDVRSEKRDALVEVADAMRRKNGFTRKLRDEQSFVAVRKSKDLRMSNAVDMALIHFSELAKALEPIL